MRRLDTERLKIQHRYLRVRNSQQNFCNDLWCRSRQGDGREENVMEQGIRQPRRDEKVDCCLCISFNQRISETHNYKIVGILREFIKWLIMRTKLLA